MVREFEFKGETFRVAANGVAGHEEVFISHLADGQESAEISFDRMIEENDMDAPLEDIIVMLCERMIPGQAIHCADPQAGFKWRETKPSHRFQQSRNQHLG